LNLKEKYAREWALSVKREQLTATLLQAYLPEYDVKLTGLGAGVDRAVEGRYSSAESAFDITVYCHGIPIAYIDVTGVRDSSELKKRIGYCVGSWKVAKAREFNVEDRVWFAFIRLSDARAYFVKLGKLVKVGVKARLVQGENEYICLNRARWLSITGFTRWLRSTASCTADADPL